MTVYPRGEEGHVPLLVSLATDEMTWLQFPHNWYSPSFPGVRTAAMPCPPSSAICHRWWRIAPGPASHMQAPPSIKASMSLLLTLDSSLVLRLSLNRVCMLVGEIEVLAGDPSETCRRGTLPCLFPVPDDSSTILTVLWLAATAGPTLPLLFNYTAVFSLWVSLVSCKDISHIGLRAHPALVWAHLSLTNYTSRDLISK